MIYVGVDPGSRCTGVAAVGQDGSVRFVDAINGTDAVQMVHRISRQLRVPADDFVALVESQEYRHDLAKGNPQQLVPLAQVAGAALATYARHERCIASDLVKPSVWKGSVPKLQHHRRLLTKLGWKWEERGGKDPYCVPDFVAKPGVLGWDAITPPQWREVLDAIGIALYLREKQERERLE